MLVVGTGAMASFLLPRLRAAGRSLQVFGSGSRRLQALQSWTSPGLGAVCDSRLVAAHSHWLVVCKSWQNSSKVELLAQAPPPQSILVLQNGLKPEAEWLKLAPGKVERGLSTYGVATIAPGQVVGGETGEITVPVGSPWPGILCAAGLVVAESSDMPAAVWRKLVVNASLNVVASLEDLRNGQVLERPQILRRAGRAAEEVAGLARAVGIDVGLPNPAWEMERVARMTSGNVCSTLADLRAGRPTEYDGINGALLRLARDRGWSLPVLEELDRDFASLLSTTHFGVVHHQAAS